MALPTATPVCSFKDDFLDSKCTRKVQCSKVTENSVKLRTKLDYSKEDFKLIQLRSGKDKIDFLCHNHHLEILFGYANKENKCCDPYGKHGAKPKKLNLREITIEFYKKCRHLSQRIARIVVPGNKLCGECRKTINSSLVQNPPPADKSSSEEESISKESSQNEASSKESSQTDATPQNSQQSDLSEESPSIAQVRQFENIAQLNADLSALNESPVNKRKLSTVKSYPADKFRRVSETLKDRFQTVAGPSVQLEDPGDFEEMIGQLKEKYHDPNTSKSEQLQILTLLPKSWSRYKIMEEFSAKEYAAKKAKELQSTKGILATPNPRLGRKLNPEYEEKIISFYENDEMSIRSTAGKNQTKSVREDGVRVKKQKRLILCGLKELHTEFKKLHPEVSVSFSKFAELRPKHCMLAGASGTHNVCVCDKHQNVKLMFDGGRLDSLTFDDSDEAIFSSYKDCLSYICCDVPTDQCYLLKCNNCPGKERLTNTLLQLFENSFVDNITYRQWTTVDRANLLTVIETTEEFVESFAKKVHKLLHHDFLAKSQAEYARKKKETLSVGEVFVQADFSENYAFVVQDAVQGYHWNNAQATVHPFVADYIDPEDQQLKTINYIVISDCLAHNVNSFYTFQKKFIEFLMSKVPSAKKIIYLTDGPTSQYKNRFNVANMCDHIEDFGLEVEWIFSATAHGKGRCDAMGGTFKRSASLASLNPKTVIITPEDLYKWAISKPDNQKMSYCYVTSTEVEATQLQLAERFKAALRIEGITKLHSIIPISKLRIHGKVFSDGNEPIEYLVREGREVPKFEEISTPGYVTVVHDGRWHLAEVNRINQDEQKIEVTLLSPPGPSKLFKFSEKSETLKVQTSEILTVIKNPKEHLTKSGQSRLSLTAENVQAVKKQFGFLED